MIPVFSHEARTSTWPFATICLIGVNVIVFLFELTMGPRFVPFLQEWGIVPARVTAEISVHNLLTIWTSMFLHVGWIHLIGNMWFLFVFGDAVEGALGWRWFLFLYFMAGFCGDVAYLMVSQGVPVPSIGASGAIAGVLGASMVMWPTARARVPGILLFLYLVGIGMQIADPIARALGLPTWMVGGPLGVALGVGTMFLSMPRKGARFFASLLRMVAVPVWVVLALFLTMNLFWEVLPLISPDLATGIGWEAHFGGFAVGAILAWAFPKHPVELEKRALLG